MTRLEVLLFVLMCGGSAALFVWAMFTIDEHRQRALDDLFGKINKPTTKDD